MKKYLLAFIFGLTSCLSDEVLILDKNCYNSNIHSEIAEGYLILNTLISRCSEDSNPLSLWALDYGVILREGGKDHIILGASVAGNEELVNLRLVLDLREEPIIIKDSYTISLRYNGKVVGEAKFIRK